MGRTWGRLYTGTRHHRKIRLVRQECPDSWWIWYPLIELAVEVDREGFISDPDCPAPTLKQLASEIGIRSKKQLSTTLESMTRWSLLRYVGEHIQLVSYNDRQFASDKSTDRVHKYRKSLNAETFPKRCEVVSGNVSETPRTETEQNRTEILPSGSVAAPAAPEGDAILPDLEQTEPEVFSKPKGKPGSQDFEKPQPEEKQEKFGPAHLVALWNELGCRPAVIKLTDDRRQKATVRLRQRADPAWWRALMEKIRDLQARGRHYLTFDFLIRNETNILKILEGAYDQDFQTSKRPAIAAGNQPTGVKIGQYARLVAGRRPGTEAQPRAGPPD